MRATLDDRPGIDGETIADLLDEADAPNARAGETITVTVYTPRQLRTAPQRGDRRTIAWAELLTWCARPYVLRPGESKDAAGGLSFTCQRDGIRRASHVEAVTALVLDHDAGAVCPWAGHVLLRQHRHILHSTASHTPAAPRWRAVLALSRPLTVEEHRLLASHVLRHMAAAGVELDQAVTRDPARLLYAPATRAPHEYQLHVSDADPLDVDRALTAAREAADRAEAARMASMAARPPAPRAGTRRERYVEGALARAAEAVRAAAEGDRHATLVREVWGLARPELELTESEIARELLPAFVAAAGTRRELEGRRTIRDAYRARQSQGGTR